MQKIIWEILPNYLFLLLGILYLLVSYQKEQPTEFVKTIETEESFIFLKKMIIYDVFLGLVICEIDGIRTVDYRSFNQGTDIEISETLAKEILKLQKSIRELNGITVM